MYITLCRATKQQMAGSRGPHTVTKHNFSFVVFKGKDRIPTFRASIKHHVQTPNSQHLSQYMFACVRGYGTYRQTNGIACANGMYHIASHVQITNASLTHCYIVTPYSNMDLGQNWSRKWLLPEPTSTYHQRCSVALNWQQYHKKHSRNVIRHRRLEITLLKLLLYVVYATIRRRDPFPFMLPHAHGRAPRRS